MNLITFETPDGEQYHEQSCFLPRKGETVMIQPDARESMKGVYVVDEVEHHVLESQVTGLVFLKNPEEGDS